jgi:hypothetical protein
MKKIERRKRLASTLPCLIPTKEEKSKSPRLNPVAFM